MLVIFWQYFMSQIFTCVLLRLRENRYDESSFCEGDYIPQSRSAVDGELSFGHYLIGVAISRGE